MLRECSSLRRLVESTLAPCVLLGCMLLLRSTPTPITERLGLELNGMHSQPRLLDRASVKTSAALNQWTTGIEGSIAAFAQGSKSFNCVPHQHTI